jgi:hypothetical protein
MNQSFSKRYGFRPQEKEITTREEAPTELRAFVVQTIYSYNKQPSFYEQ